MYFLGIDIGTSGTKTVLFDERGKIKASDLAQYPIYQPKIGWAEQKPQDWWGAVCATIKNVLAKSGVRDIAGIGLSGQMHGLVLLDKNDEPLRDAIIWCDQRTQRECLEITEIIGRERLIEITANPALTGFTASKIRYVQKNEPEIFERAVKIMLPKDYIRYMLTGEFATEVSDASGMQLMDIANRRWSGEVIDKLGIKRGMLGKMYESFEITGFVSKSAAALTGLGAGVPVVGGAGDQAAAAVGNGIVKSGIVSSVIGTSGVVFASVDSPLIDRGLGRVHTFCHALPDTWHVMGVTQAAGLSLKWFRDNFCGEQISAGEETKTDPYVLMDEMAKTIPPGSEGVIYLPYLMGERTPHLDPRARGVFFGLSAVHTKAHFIRAIMEGVAFSLNDCMGIIKELGISPSLIIASGGGGKSPLWRQIQADVFGMPLAMASAKEAGALGAAILAGVGTGAYKSVREGCAAVVKEGEKVMPNIGVYDSSYKKFGEIYGSIKHIFREG